MTDKPARMVIDCSDTGDAEAHAAALEQFTQALADAATSEDVHAAAERFRASAARGVLVPLTTEELDQRDADHAEAVTRDIAQWRTIRNAALSASDWTQLPDAPLGNVKAWQEYRQALRDAEPLSELPAEPQLER